MAAASTDKVMKVLEKAGTEQNRKVYARHGGVGAMFGVSYAELGKLKKKIKQDHALALGLWESGVHDARILATKIADAEAMKASEIDAWARTILYQVHLLASVYGWSESEILALSPWRRHLYLQMIGET